LSNSVYSEYYMNVRLDNYQIIKAVQGEVNTRLVTINFMNDNVPYNLVGLFTTINMIKNDGNVIFNDGTIIDPVNGVAQFLITSEMCTNAGTFDVFFKIYGSSPPSELKVTGFQLIVEPANNDAGIISSNEFTALQTLIAQVQPAIDNINTAIENANTQINTFITDATEQVNVAISNADTAATNANNAADLATKTADTLYANLYIDLETMELIETTPDNYLGGDFVLTNDGELEVTI
jgi:hypothetical protein